jgi:PAS domain S-box-containing protein
VTIKNHTSKESTSYKPDEENKNEVAKMPVFEDPNAILSFLLSNSKELIILLDRNFAIQFINENSKKQFAVLFNIELQKGQNLLQVASEENQPFIREIYEDVLRGNQRETESLHIVNGNTVYLRNSFRPAKDEQDRIVGIIINTYDITDYKKNQIALEEAELRWQYASEGSHQGLWDWNIETGYTYYSTSYKRLYGFEDDELTNHIDEWSSRIHPDDRKITDKALENHLLNSEQVYDSTYRIKAKDGTYRWVLARGIIVSWDENGKPLRMIGTHTDITRYKVTEANYRLLFYSNPLPMWTLDPATLRFLDVNDMAVEHYGYSREEFLNMTIKDIQPLNEPFDHRFFTEASKQTFSVTGLRHQKKDGTIIYVDLTGHIIVELDGRKISLITCQDVTDKMLAEQRLLNSEIKYRTLFVNNPLPSWIYNPETQQLLEVNEAAVAHYGYTKEEFKHLTIRELHPIDERAEADRAVQEALKKQTSIGTWQHQKKNGERIFVVVRSSAIEYQNQKARLVVIHDKTDQVKAEQELLKSNERYLFASKATSDAIWDFYLEQNTLEWGEGLYTLFGYKSEEISHQKWTNLVHPDDIGQVTDSFSQAINDPNQSIWRSQYRFKAANNTYRHVFDRGFILRDATNKPYRLIGSMQDITDLKLKEKELTESNERFDAVLKATNDLIWDWDLESENFYRDTDGLQKVYGVSNEADIRSIHTWLQRIHPEDSNHVQNTINDILRSTDQDTFEVEYRFRRDDNRYNFVYDRGIILRNADGKPVRMIGAAQNITERKRLEMQLLKKELDKQKLISQASIETQEQERSEIGKELHDNVNQVLTTTKLYLDLSLSNAELKDELILKSSQNIIYVINEIRQLSRSLMNPSLGDLGLIESINELIDNINLTGRLKARLKAASSLENTLSENQKLMIYRIVQEAINNALKHAKAHNVTITIQDNDQMVELFIEDDGIGFNFDTVKKGSGLKHIQNRVYLANGTLTVNSAPGKGCLIMINFPKHTNPI